jgi:hypothetical protein
LTAALEPSVDLRMPAVEGARSSDAGRP